MRVSILVLTNLEHHQHHTGLILWKSGMRDSADGHFLSVANFAHGVVMQEQLLSQKWKLTLLSAPL